MPLVLGTQLGPYEIVSLLGAGGMGEVYRAKDTKLGRDIALKILPEEFTDDRQRMARFEREAYAAGFPEWLAGGKSPGFNCVFSKDSDGSFCVASADGTGKTAQLLPVGSAVGFSVSPDQKSMLFAKENSARNFDIWRAVLETGAHPEPFLSTPFNELGPQISPAGKYVAYQSDESGNYQVYVRPFPTGEGRWMISTNGGATPKWSPKGDELFYLQGDTLDGLACAGVPHVQAWCPARTLFRKEGGLHLICV
jgi:hypothetical protein